METRVDCHIKTLSPSVIARAAARGVDAVVYAPHFTPLPAIEATAAAYDDAPVTVIPGREIFTGRWHSRRHILAVGMREPVPDFIPLEAALDALAAQGATVLVPHPGFANVSLGAAELATYHDQLDAIEVENFKSRRWHNRRARALAADAGLPTFGSSYAHLPASVGATVTVFEASLRDPEAVIAAIAGEVPRRIERDQRPQSQLQGLLEFSHLGWENTVQKLRRVGSPGPAATHPHAAVYEGRFDPVSVY
jgi:Predicted metal-dependent phosphoesterases (PHP family)